MNEIINTESINESISIYKSESIYSDLKVFITQIENNLQDNNDDELRKICEQIEDFILRQYKNVVETKEDIVFVATGSTSSCYKSADCNQIRYIYKIFSPNLLSGENLHINESGQKIAKYCWIRNCATVDERQSFLRRFVRFVRQKEEIDTYIRKANEEEKNVLVEPEFIFTSMGFALRVKSYASCTLEQTFQGMKGKNTLKDLEYVISLVLEAAENIRDFCHNYKIYHGDIKPENFLNIKIDNNRSCVRNIDFDTWLSEEKINKGYLVLSATTPLFYNYKKVSPNQTFEQLSCFDIKALAKMLMYALSLLVGVEEQNIRMQVGVESKWEAFFFETEKCPAEKVFNTLCANKKLSGVFVFEQIKTLLTRCSENCKPKFLITDINSFIEELSKIKLLLNFKPAGVLTDESTKTPINEVLIRYLSLEKLNNEIENDMHFVHQGIGELIDNKDNINYSYDNLFKSCGGNIRQNFIVKILGKYFNGEHTSNN